jgi:hypothetical protein
MRIAFRLPSLERGISRCQSRVRFVDEHDTAVGSYLGSNHFLPIPARSRPRPTNIGLLEHRVIAGHNYQTAFALDRMTFTPDFEESP